MWLFSQNTRARVLRDMVIYLVIYGVENSEKASFWNCAKMPLWNPTRNYVYIIGFNHQLILKDFTVRSRWSARPVWEVKLVVRWRGGTRHRTFFSDCWFTPSIADVFGVMEAYWFNEYIWDVGYASRECWSIMTNEFFAHLYCMTAEYADGSTCMMLMIPTSFVFHSKALEKWGNS